MVLRYTSRTGSSSLLVLIGLLVLLTLITKEYFSMNQADNSSAIRQVAQLDTEPLPTDVSIAPIYPTITPTSVGLTLIETPEQVVQKYYTDYLLCVKEYFKTPSNKTAFEACHNHLPGVITPSLIPKLTAVKFADPIMCAQYFPREVKADKAVVTNNTATVSLRENFGRDYIISVSLALSPDGWHITDITCPG